MRLLPVGTALRSLLYAALAMTSHAFAQNSPVTVRVDATSNLRPISPLIYGVAHAGAAALADLNVPLNRWGGNNVTRYNWRINADNRGADWFFESIGYNSAAAGEVADTFVAASMTGGAQPMITIPMAGWVAKLGANRSKLASYRVSKYGAQRQTDYWFTDAGNGVRLDGSQITDNDPNDANVPADPEFQRDWLQHLLDRWGGAAFGGVPFYLMDNEPSIWHSTHRDIHPEGASMEEIRDKTISYATMIRSMDPDALIAGPEEWGWNGYFYSGYDQQWAGRYGWGNFPDRNAHGGMDYLPWLLRELRAYESATGLRPLDVFSVHFYPQGGEFGNDVSQAAQLRRNRSTRALWDPAYRDETWINAVVQLIPRIRGWVDSLYPGLQTAITEYNWGAENHVNGATAQADVLGIFGREGLDMAARWTTPSASTPTYKAIKMYRNYDGAGSTFGDISVSASFPNPDQLSAFAATRSSDGALTIMVVGKYLSGSTPLTMNVSGFPAGASAQVWQLTSANQIKRLADASVSGGTLATTIPSQSVTLFVLSAN